MWDVSYCGELSWDRVNVPGAEREQVRSEGNFGNSLFSIPWSYENNHNQFFQSSPLCHYLHTQHGKLPAVTHIWSLLAAPKMTSLHCYCVWVAAAKFHLYTTTTTKTMKKTWNVASIILGEIKITEKNITTGSKST